MGMIRKQYLPDNGLTGGGWINVCIFIYIHICKCICILFFLHQIRYLAHRWLLVLKELKRITRFYFQWRNLLSSYTSQRHPSVEHYFGTAPTTEKLQVKWCLDYHYSNHIIVIDLCCILISCCLWNSLNRESSKWSRPHFTHLVVIPQKWIISGNIFCTSHSLRIVHKMISAQGLIPQCWHNR